MLDVSMVGDELESMKEAVTRHVARVGEGGIWHVNVSMLFSLLVLFHFVIEFLKKGRKIGGKGK